MVPSLVFCLFFNSKDRFYREKGKRDFLSVGLLPTAAEAEPNLKAGARGLLHMSAVQAGTQALS